ncbi:MFS transporter [Bifidobacterium sp.]|uniref:MFS transporter n=1 Tax=Bifidobacterium sp. TaxID=41200 RepID=UPI0025C6E2BF|nr:MFS transporter [Bifidobacterium sp.]MCI1225491.1 MFS transporter [Bifidobacterium sp.]
MHSDFSNSTTARNAAVSNTATGTAASAAATAAVAIGAPHSVGASAQAAAPTASQGDKDSVSLWEGTDYGAWLTADTSSTLGASLVGFAIPLIALTSTGSPAQASFISGLESCVLAAFSIPGGVVQDRVDRRRLMLAWGISGTVLFACMAAFDWMNMLGMVALVVFAVLMGLRSGLLSGTSHSMLRGIVPDAQLPHALTINNGRDAALNILGDPLSGLLMKFGNMMPLLTAALLNIVATMGSWHIRRYWKHGDDDANPAAAADISNNTVDNAEPSAPQSQVATWRGALDGIVYLFRWPFQRRMTLGSLIFNGSINALILITQMHIVQVTHSTFTAALVLSISSLGMLLGAFATSHIISRVPGGVIFAVSFILLSASSFGVALPQSVWLKGAFLFFGLLLLPATNAVGGGFSALLVSKNNQGRLDAAQTLCGMGAYAIFVSLAGVLMTKLGYTAAALIMCAGLCGATSLLLTLKPLITLPGPESWESHIDACQLHRL